MSERRKPKAKKKTAARPLKGLRLKALPALGLWAAGFVLTYGAGVALLGAVGAPEPWIPVGAGMAAAATFQMVGRRRANSELPTNIHLRADFRFGTALDKAVDAEQVAAIVGGLIKKTLKPTHGYFWLLDRDRHEFNVSTTLGLPPDLDFLPEARVQAWQTATTAGITALSAEELMMVAEMERWIRRQELTWIEPVISQGRTLGLLTLANRTDGKPWSIGERWLVARAMRETAQALVNLDLARSDRARRSRLDNLSQRYKDAEKRAVTDGLTNLGTHIFYKEQLAQRFHESKRHAAPLAVLLLDIDHFKRINDTYGHPMGDEVLKQVSKTVKDLARACDTVARYGGEEFALILPRTDMTGALTLAERIREAVSQIDLLDARGRSIPIVTTSVGVAVLEMHDADPEALIARADAALYLAKREGRNQVRQAS